MLANNFIIIIQRVFNNNEKASQEEISQEFFYKMEIKVSYSTKKVFSEEPEIDYTNQISYIYVSQDLIEKTKYFKKYCHC